MSWLIEEGDSTVRVIIVHSTRTRMTLPWPSAAICSHKDTYGGLRLGVEGMVVYELKVVV